MDSPASADIPLPDNRHILFYDGDCPMCCSAVGLLSEFSLLGQAVAVAWQDGALNHPEIQERIKSEAVLWDAGTKRYESGINAFIALLRLNRRFPVLTGFFRIPGVAFIARQCYKAIAMNRHRLSRNGKTACSGTCARK